MRATVALLLVGGLVGVLSSGCGGGEGGVEQAPSTDARTLLTRPQLSQALLTARTVGASYARQDGRLGAASGSLGCLDALDPRLLGAGVEGTRRLARREYDTAAALPTSSVTSVVVTFGSDRAVVQALDAFSTAAGDCTRVREDVGGSSAELEVTSRLVPVKAPVQREVLVEGRGNIGNGVTAPAIGVSVKVGRVDNHLVAVETTGVGDYAPDITPYYNNARARLLAVLAGDDPGPGRRIDAD